MRNFISSRLFKTPRVPATVYSKLPAYWQESVSHFSTDREKDVFVTCALSLLSGCFKDVKGRYCREILYPNLYSLVVAPPGSGKGVGNSAFNCIEKIDEILLSNCWGKLFGEEDEIDSNNQMSSLVIPADSSAAAFLSKLSENGGSGILYESELDTLTNSQKQDWGNYSDKLRAAFHHEKISFSRAADGGKTVEILSPKLSICMLGTPNQARTFLPSPENGLFSRFIFYVYSQPHKFNSRKPEYDKPSNREIFRGLGDKLIQIVRFTESHPFEFKFSDEQWSEFHKYFDKKLQTLVTLHGDEAAGIVYRMGTIVFRIAMILSCFSKWESKNEEGQYECPPILFEVAINLGDIYLEHGMTMLQIVPNSQASGFTSENEKFLYSLPLRFPRMDAVKIGKKMNFSETSVDRKLAGWIESGLLHRPKSGYYEKTEFKDEVSDKTDKLIY